MDIDGWVQTVILSLSFAPLQGDDVIILVTELESDQLQWSAGLSNLLSQCRRLSHMAPGCSVVKGLVNTHLKVA